MSRHPQVFASDSKGAVYDGYVAATSTCGAIAISLNQRVVGSNPTAPTIASMDLRHIGRSQARYDGPRPAKWRGALRERHTLLCYDIEDAPQAEHRSHPQPFGERLGLQHAVLQQRARHF